MSAKPASNSEPDGPNGGAVSNGTMEPKPPRTRGTGSLFRRVPKGPWIARWTERDGRRRIRRE